MRSRIEIENLLNHMQSDTCGTSGTPANEVAIGTLEWVIGDDTFRKAFTDQWDTLYDIAANSYDPAVLRIALNIALQRLEPPERAAARISRTVQS